MIILMKSLEEEKKASGLKTKVYLLILLALITCSCSGLKFDFHALSYFFIG